MYLFPKNALIPIPFKMLVLETNTSQGDENKCLLMKVIQLLTNLAIDKKTVNISYCKTSYS